MCSSDLGGRLPVALEGLEAEARYAAEPRDELTPDRLYDRRWAESLLDRALSRLRADYHSTGRLVVYLRLQQHLWGRQQTGSYAEIGAELGLSEAAVKVAVHRLRQRFRELLQDEVGRTVERLEDIRKELQHLLESLGGEV